MLTVVGQNVACSGTQRVLDLEDKASAGDSRFIAIPQPFCIAKVTLWILAGHASNLVLRIF